MFNDPTFLGKLFFSVYNVGSILLLNLLLEKEISGAFLYLLSQVHLTSMISRLGSDFYWPSAEKKKIRIVENEFKIQFVIVLIATALFIVISPYELSAYNFLIYLFVFWSSNLMQLIGRHYQKHEKHIISLFLFTVGPMGVCVPLLLIFDDYSFIVIIAISNFCICVPFLKHFYNNIEVQIDDGNFLARLSFFPMLGFGVLNQNMLTLMSGLSSRQAEITMLVLFQRLAGLISWPLVLFMQSNLPAISASTKNFESFSYLVKDYVFRYLPLITILTAISILVSSLFLIYEDHFSIEAVVTMLLITFGCILNALFAYVQYQMGLKGMAFQLSAILICSVAISSGLYFIIDADMLGAGGAFLAFHMVVHLSGAIALVRAIKLDEIAAKTNY